MPQAERLGVVLLVQVDLEPVPLVGLEGPPSALHHSQPVPGFLLLLRAAPLDSVLNRQRIHLMAEALSVNL